MKDKIKEVQEYFINKIIEGNFSILKNTNYTVEILIDDEYYFTLWTGEDKSEFINIDLYQDFDAKHFMNLQHNFSFNEKRKIFSHLKEKTKKIK